MGKYKIVFDESAQKHLILHHKSGDKGALKKLSKILEELANHPKTGTGNPEILKYNLIGFWSRRINQKDRLVYKIEERIVTVFIISAKGHYSDK